MKQKKDILNKVGSFEHAVKQTTGSIVLYDLYIKTLEFIGERYETDSEELYKVVTVATNNLKSLIGEIAKQDANGARVLEDFRLVVDRERRDAVEKIIAASGRFGVTIDLMRQILGAQFATSEAAVSALIKEEADRLVNVGKAVHPHGSKRYFAVEYEEKAQEFNDRFSAFLSLNNRERARKGTGVKE